MREYVIKVMSYLGIVVEKSYASPLPLYVIVHFINAGSLCRM